MGSSKTVKDDEVNDALSAALVVAPSSTLAAAVQQAAEYRRYTKAASTQRAYRSDWSHFQAWATKAGIPALPASPETVCAYIGQLAQDGRSVASIERFLAAASFFHRISRLDFPRGAVVVRDTLEGIRRQLGIKRSKKAPLSVKALVDVCERLRREAGNLPDNERISDLRSRALLTVGWFCTLRGASLVSIRREHVRLVRLEGDGWVDDDERPTGLIIHLPGSKTDQRKEGRDVAVHAQADGIVCPVRTLVAYLRVAHIAPGDRIFPISERTVSRLIKRLVASPAHGHRSMREIADCASCSAAAQRFATHSLRRGSATALAEKGVAERDIMRHGGWKSERVMRGYIEHATLFKNNPTEGLVAAKAEEAPKPSRPTGRGRSRSARKVRRRRRILRML